MKCPGEGLGPGRRGRCSTASASIDDYAHICDRSLAIYRSLASSYLETSASTCKCLQTSDLAYTYRWNIPISDHEEVHIDLALSRKQHWISSGPETVMIIKNKKAGPRQ